MHMYIVLTLPPLSFNCPQVVEDHSQLPPPPAVGKPSPVQPQQQQQQQQQQLKRHQMDGYAPQACSRPAEVCVQQNVADAAAASSARNGVGGGEERGGVSVEVCSGEEQQHTQAGRRGRQKMTLKQENLAVWAAVWPVSVFVWAAVWPVSGSV